jgi:hypothetical protein
MRKPGNKLPKTEKVRALPGRRLSQSVKKYNSIPVYAATDDEEYFFETEDV